MFFSMARGMPGRAAKHLKVMFTERPGHLVQRREWLSRKRTSDTGLGYQVSARRTKVRKPTPLAPFAM